MGRKFNIGIVLLIISGLAHEVGNRIGTMRHSTTPYFWGIGIAAGCVLIGLVLIFTTRK